MRLMDFCEKCGTIMDLPGGSKKSFEKMKEITCFNPNCTFKRPIQGKFQSFILLIRFELSKILSFMKILSGFLCNFFLMIF